MSHPLHYFTEPARAAADALLQRCIGQGWVPPQCLLAGAVVADLMQRGTDPCRGCRGPRHHCGGRPFEEELGPERRRRVLGTAQSLPQDGTCRFFFAGVDPAPSEGHRSDDGGIVGGCATPQNPPAEGDLAGLSDNEADWNFDFVYARRLTSVERASARQWAGVLHELHQGFAFQKILMDPGGGGLFVQRELKAPKQFIGGREVEVTPIADQVTGPMDVVKGYFILHLFKRGDPGIERLWPKLAGDDLLNDAAYGELKTAFDRGMVGLVPPAEEIPAAERAAWTPERRQVLATLQEMVNQFKGVSVAVDHEGNFQFTRRNARQFSSLGKKDLMSAGMYAYLAFRIWLRSEDWRSSMKTANRKLFSMGK